MLKTILHHLKNIMKLLDFKKIKLNMAYDDETDQYTEKKIPEYEDRIFESKNKDNSDLFFNLIILKYIFNKIFFEVLIN